MKLPLGTNNVFHCPEGRYHGILEAADEPPTPAKLRCALQVRLRFRVRHEDGSEYLVARTFCADLSYGSDLYDFLDKWLNDNFDSVMDDDGEADLDLLVRMPVDLLITHDSRKQHKHGFPLVKISGAFPRGTLVG